MVRELLTRHRGLVVLLAAGFALRSLAVVAIWPGIWFSDSNTYVEAAATGQLSPIRPVGYSLVVAPFWELGSAGALIVFQHLIGLALVVLLYALLLRVGAPRWLAVLGAAPAALDLYLVLVEHTIMAETVFHAALLGCIALVLCTKGPGHVVHLGVAGLLLGYVGVVRSVGVPFLAVFVGYLLVRRVGWRGLAAFVACWALVTVGYMAIYRHQHGVFAVSESSAQFLYGKVAPLADCDELGDLPQRERRYCPDPDDRLSANAYIWSHESPIAGRSIEDAETIRGFALRVIRDDPWRYARLVLGGVLHYFRPGHPISGNDYPVQAWQFPKDPRQWSYPGYRGPIRRGDPVAHGLHPITEPNRYVARMADRYRFHVGVSRSLHHVQRFLYTPGPLLALCLLLVIAALMRRVGAPRLRADAALLAGLALVALFVSQLLSVFSYRYGFGMALLLPPAAALAVTALRERAATS